MKKALERTSQMHDEHEIKRHRPQASPNATILDRILVKPDLMCWTTTPSAAEDRENRGEHRQKKVSPNGRLRAQWQPSEKRNLRLKS